MGFEIERKFLVTSLPCPLPRPENICQGYITDHPERVVRVRTMGSRAFLTIKGKTTRTVRREFEYPIPLDEAMQMLEQICIIPLVEKKRYTLNYENFEWTIDVFSGKNQGLILAEIELEAEDQAFSKPPWAGRDVSQDPRYFNSNLVASPFSTW